MNISSSSIDQRAAGPQPPDADRLIQNVLSELGWDADASGIGERVRKLDVGLPREDEFS